MTKKDIDKTQVVDVKKIKKEESHEMDTSFLEQEHNYTIVKVILCLFILLIAVALVYYFLANNTKIMYKTIYDKYLINENISLSYKLNASMETDNKSLKKLAKIIDKLTYEGTLLFEDDLVYTSGNITYEESKMLDFGILTNDNKLYLELPGAIDKPIIYTPSNDTEYEKVINTYKTNYESIKNGIVKAINNTLETATYKKMIVKENDKYVKKSTLVIDNKFIETIYTYLLHDDEFIKSFAALENKTESEIIDNINKSITKLEEETNEKDYYIAIYTKVITNEFVKLEIDFDTYKFNLTKTNDIYNFEYLENYFIRYKGNITVNGKDNNYLGKLNLSLIKEKTDLAIDYNVNLHNTDIKPLDKSIAINYNDLTETELDKINSWITDNKTLNKFLSDLD